MRREEGVEDRLGGWLGCWEGWEEAEEGREVWRGRRLGGRGGERGARRNEDTQLTRRDHIAQDLSFSCAMVNYSLKSWN